MKAFSIILTIIFCVAFSSPGLCLDSQDIIRLKKGGISGETIGLIVKEKVIETCAFTVQEILDLKKAGLKDETIRIIIRNGSFLKDTKPIVYGKDIRPIKFTTARDIIELKEAGLSDEVIKAIVTCASTDANDLEREKAWEMLKNMGIIIDKRKGSE